MRNRSPGSGATTTSPSGDKKQRHLVSRQRPVHVHVGEHEVLFVGVTLEWNVGGLPHAAVHAVAANHPRRVDSVSDPVHDHVRIGAVVSHPQASDLRRPHHLAAELVQRGEQDAFGEILRAHQGEGVAARNLPEVERQQRPVAIADAEDRDRQTSRQHLGDDAERLQHFERPRVDDRGARGVRALR